MQSIKSILLIAILVVATQSQAQTKVIAHRGAWKSQNLPENSIASLNHAIQLNCFGSEFDVHLTKDDVLVVNHDKDFYGIDIERSTYQELLSKKHPNGESIPTLEAYLREGMKQHKTRLVLEIKSSIIDKARTLKTTEMTVAMVNKLKAQKLVDYICFDYDAGKLIHQLAPKADVAYLNGDITPDQAKKDGYTGIDYHFNVFKEHPDWIKEAHNIGLSVNVWTVNTDDDIRNALNQKVDYITTNEPERVFELIKAQ